MAQISKDVFGFDELEKSFKRLEKKYPNQADRFLKAESNLVSRRTKQLTPVYKGRAKAGIKPRQLKKSWKSKNIKEYQGGTVRVARVESTAPHAHLIEYGHKIYEAPAGLTKKASSYGIVDRALLGIKTHGRTKAYKMLDTAMEEAKKKFDKDAQKMLDRLISEEGFD